MTISQIAFDRKNVIRKKRLPGEKRVEIKKIDLTNCESNYFLTGPQNLVAKLII